MIRKAVTIKRLRESSGRDDLVFWRRRDASERVDAGKVAGKYGDVDVHYLGRDQYAQNKRATGRKKDLADLEALGEK